MLGDHTANDGLIVIITVIGYPSRQAYLETIDADEFPRHEVGITSIPRSEPVD